MCLHARGASQWNVSKARGGNGKNPARENKVWKKEKDKKIDSKNFKKGFSDALNVLNETISR